MIYLNIFVSSTKKRQLSMRLFVSGFKAWVNFKTDFLCLIVSIQHVFCLTHHTALPQENYPSSYIQKLPGSWEWLTHWAIHHIYQDIQKGPVLTLIFNGILTWTCRLIYDTLVRTGSIIQIFLYFSSITLYMFIHKYAIRYRLFGVTTDI